MKKLSLQKGFTLVELLVVIAIIGILSTLLLLQLNTARSKARDVKRVTAVNQIRTAVELYYDDNGQYPTAISDILIGQKYMANGRVPLDPSTLAPYGYSTFAVSGTVTKFQVRALLENNNKSALDNDADITAAWAISGADATCATVAATCIFDLGVQ